jgi:hypothetical protein
LLTNQQNESEVIANNFIIGNEIQGVASLAVYDCSQLPLCKVSCNGPSEEILQATTKSCSCMIEWLWNAYIAQGALALLVFFTLNLSRVLLCRGLVRVWWRMLSPPVFQCLTDCNEQGVTLQLITDDRNGEDKLMERTELGCMGCISGEYQSGTAQSFSAHLLKG